MKLRRCPRCRSTRIFYDAGIITGMYNCKKCGLISPMVLEEDVELKEFEKISKEENKDN